MKKIIVVALGVVFLSALTSCKKDWTCECQYEGEKTSYTIENRSKKDAKQMCTGSVNIGLVNVGGDKSCAIK